MKSHLSPLLCVLIGAACTTNKPADAPEESARNEVISPVAASEELSPPSDGTLEPTPSVGTPEATHDTTAPSHPPEAKPAPAVPPPPVATDDKARDMAVAPDNTKVNKRDTKSSALTPLDQGGGQSDLDITQKIRQAVVGDGSLSFTAKNVKIITRGGKVTLRGPVNTAGERTTILAAAQKVAGASNVDNQLEVTN